MSTYFYFECLSHQPPLPSHTEITQHDDRYLEVAIRIAQGAPATEFTDYDYLGAWTRDGIHDFLTTHEACAIGIVNEYGEQRPIPGRGLDRRRANHERVLTRGREDLDRAGHAARIAESQIAFATGQLAALDTEES